MKLEKTFNWRPSNLAVFQNIRVWLDSPFDPSETFEQLESWLIGYAFMSRGMEESPKDFIEMGLREDKELFPDKTPSYRDIFTERLCDYFQKKKPHLNPIESGYDRLLVNFFDLLNSDVKEDNIQKASTDAAMEIFHDILENKNFCDFLAQRQYLGSSYTRALSDLLLKTPARAQIRTYLQSLLPADYHDTISKLKYAFQSSNRTGSWNILFDETRPVVYGPELV